CIDLLVKEVKAEREQQKIIEERAEASFPRDALVKSVSGVLSACEGRLSSVSACSEVVSEFEERMVKIGEVDDVNEGIESCSAFQHFEEASNALEYAKFEKMKRLRESKSLPKEKRKAIEEEVNGIIEKRRDEVEEATRVLVGVAESAFPEVY